MRERKQFSIKDGYSFVFDDEGNKISAWFSAFSGHEKIYLNAELISEQRNLSTRSSRTFRVGPNEYSINMEAVSVLLGPYVCTLYKNGKAFKRQKLCLRKEGKSRAKFSLLQVLLHFIVFCVMLWATWIYFDLPEKYFLAVIGFGFLLITMGHFSLRLGSTLVIEDEEIA